MNGRCRRRRSRFSIAPPARTNACPMSVPLIPRAVSTNARTPRIEKSGAFEGTAPDSLVLGEHDPAALPDRPKPVSVRRIGREMVVVNLHPQARLTESLG